MCIKILGEMKKYYVKEKKGDVNCLLVNLWC